MKEKRHIKILYIGNDLSKYSKYPTTMELLSSLLTTEGYSVKRSSSKKNKLVRLLDMLLSVINYKSYDYLLIDTYSTQNFYYAYFTSSLANILNKKYIPILHGGDLPKRLSNSPKLSKRIFKRAYKVVAPSMYLKSAFESKGYEVLCIPNILQIENYKYKERKLLSPKLLWVRSLKSIYNPLMAVKVLEKLKGEYSNAKLCIVGPFVEEKILISIKREIKTKKLEQNIELTGVLSKEDWHKKSEEFDIFINTTNFDNTPISVMEAMALGLPVVSTNVGGIPYLLKNKEDGILVEKENAEMMFDEVNKLIKNFDTKIALNARKKVEKFGWNVVKKQWVDILN